MPLKCSTRAAGSFERERRDLFHHALWLTESFSLRAGLRTRARVAARAIWAG
jgi:hypothetical protein